MLQHVQKMLQFQRHIDEIRKYENRAISIARIAKTNSSNL
ncbi:hypothetical protein GCHA_4104 [Paraglaciecola chathamensis S18K6]|uniref:Uncharacterized protein n=1 Tax=Paraglaciecola chathamensis S18K6 TaxID=1127672 RepID=A0AAV3V6J0_9ALTE|nr:hypothetical protein GCHA_4104 [Paraglaciecola chathamensis S18K6]